MDERVVLCDAFTLIDIQHENNIERRTIDVLTFSLTVPSDIDQFITETNVLPRSYR